MGLPTGTKAGAILTKKEKSALTKKLGDKMSSMYSTVAKLYVCGQSERNWTDAETWGVICLVINRSHQPPCWQIQIRDMNNFEMLFTHELYVGMNYVESDPQFHSLEVDAGFVGFSFADASEAAEFKRTVVRFIPKDVPTKVIKAPTTLKDKFRMHAMNIGSMVGVTGKMVYEVGAPTNFEHKQHIGYDPAKGFECNDIPEQWKSVFKSAGVRKKDLKNPEKAAVIYETLQNELGDDFASKPPPPSLMAKLQQPPAVPGAAPPVRGAAPPVPNARRGPPSVPTRAGPPSVPSRGGPPGVPSRAPPLPVARGPPATPGRGPPAAPAAPTPPGPPAAPPAPMAPAAPPAPGPPPTIGSAPPAPAPGRGGLLGQIQGGASLKKAPPKAAAPVSARGGLLGEIQAGRKLKKVDPNERRANLPEMSPDKADNIMGALSAAMTNRFKAMNDDDEDDDDDEDWSD